MPNKRNKSSSHRDFSGDFSYNINWIYNTHFFVYQAEALVSNLKFSVFLAIGIDTTVF